MTINAVANSEGLEILKNEVKERVKEFVLLGFESSDNLALDGILEKTDCNFAELSPFIFYKSEIDSAYYDDNGELTFELVLPYSLDTDKYIYGIALLGDSNIIVSHTKTPKIAKTTGIGGTFIYKVAISGEAGDIIYADSDYLSIPSFNEYKRKIEVEQARQDGDITQIKDDLQTFKNNILNTDDVLLPDTIPTDSNVYSALVTNTMFQTKIININPTGVDGTFDYVVRADDISIKSHSVGRGGNGYRGRTNTASTMWGGDGGCAGAEAEIYYQYQTGDIIRFIFANLILTISQIRAGVVLHTATTTTTTKAITDIAGSTPSGSSIVSNFPIANLLSPTLGNTYTLIPTPQYGCAGSNGRDSSFGAGGTGGGGGGTGTGIGIGGGDGGGGGGVGGNSVASNGGAGGIPQALLYIQRRTNA